MIPEPKCSLHPFGSNRVTMFSTFLCAMILATCLAACLIEQPSINLLNIYINNNKGNNNDDVIVQNMQFATLSYIICYFVKENNASFFFLQELVL